MECECHLLLIAGAVLAQDNEQSNSTSQNLPHLAFTFTYSRNMVSLDPTHEAITDDETKTIDEAVAALTAEELRKKTEIQCKHYLKHHLLTNDRKGGTLKGQRVQTFQAELTLLPRP